MLEASQAARPEQSVASQGRAVREAMPPLPVRQPELPVVAVASVARVEQDPRIPWQQRFKTEGAKREFAELSPDQVALVERASDLLVAEAVAWRVTGKPIAAKSDHGAYDHASFVLKRAPDDQEFWGKLIAQLNVSLNESVRKCLRRCSGGTIKYDSVVCLNHPTDPTLAIFRVQFVVPRHTISYDVRHTHHDETLVVKNGELKKLFLEDPNTLRLMPFILKAAALKIAPDRGVYFDGPISGGDKAFHKGDKNLIIGLIPEQRKRVGFEDPADSGSACKVNVYPNDEHMYANFVLASRNGEGDPVLDMAHFGESRLREEAPLAY